MLGLATGALDEIVVLGAHCDDIAIGMGGTLLTLAQTTSIARVTVLVLTGGETERELEERAALAALCPGVAVEVTVLAFPDGRTPAHWNAIKDAVAELRRASSGKVVFAPQRHDAHQDHRLLAEIVPTEFRDHLVLGYEILKWETDTPQPSVFHPITAEIAHEKVRLLHEHYRSQTSHDWFDDESFLGLARLRGVHCRHRYAEAFTLEKALIGFD